MKKFFIIVNSVILLFFLTFPTFSLDIPKKVTAQSPTISQSDPAESLNLLRELLRILFSFSSNPPSSNLPTPTRSINPSLSPTILPTSSPTPLISPNISPTPSSQPPNQSFVYYCQHNVSWKYACGTNLNACNPNNQCGLGYAGCGPTSLAMIISTLVSKMTPPDVDAIFQQNGWRAGCGAGSNMYSALTSNWLTSLGLKTGPLLLSGNSLDLAAAKNFIDNGAIIIASSTQFPCQSCTKPTLIDHIFVIDNVDILNNTVSIRDPDNCSWWNGDIETKPLIMNITTFPWYYAFPVNKI